MKNQINEFSKPTKEELQELTEGKIFAVNIETKRKRLTIDELRKMKNYENISDDEADKIIFAVRSLALIFYEYINIKQKEENGL